MAVPNDNPPRGTNNIRRVNNTTIGLAIGGAVLVLLLGLSFFYPGHCFTPGSVRHRTPARIRRIPQRRRSRRDKL